VFRYQLNGRAREMGLGAFHTFGLREARGRAEACRRLLADGVDPIEQRNLNRSEAAALKAKLVTFGHCCEQYIAAHRSGWKNMKHAAQWDATLRTYCVVLWHLDVAKIDTTLVMKCLDPIWTTKTETASRLRGRIESVLAWATVRRFRVGDNPAAWRNHLDQLLPKRSKVQIVSHRPALPYAEVASFMKLLRSQGGLSARVLELQILTATRPGEAAGAQWDEFDIKAAVWTIPAHRMKAAKEHRVALSNAALSLLALLPQINELVFPGVRGNAITTAAGMNLLKTIDPRITAHGFRSTFRDWAAETTKHPREVIEAAMAHRLKDKSEAAYQRGDLLARRLKLMNDWGTYCNSG
jgi:integrase